MNRILAIAAMAALASCTQTPEQLARQQAADARELADVLGNRIPGKPEQCISAARADGPIIIGESTLIYRDGANRLYRNDIIGSCPGLRGDPLIISELYGNQICRNDQFRVLERGTSIPSASCRYGDFVPYKRPSNS